MKINELETQYDFVIIGAGLFGSAIKKYIESFEGKRSVLMIDNCEELSGSKCSAGLYKDGWIEKIKAEAETTFQVFSELGIIPEDIEFFNPTSERIEKFKRFAPEQILEKDFFKAKVLKVRNSEVFLEVEGIDVVSGSFSITPRVATVIAAGAWTDKILALSGYKTNGITPHWGASFVYGGLKLEDNFIDSWAPFKQHYMFEDKNRGYSYFANSTSLKISNIEKYSAANSDALLKATNRMVNQSSGWGLSIDAISAVNEGVRPFLPKGDVKYVRQHDSKLYSATGGRKSSTVLSGYVAKTFYEEFQ